jgi:ABC-type transport system involved in multi-copper enzyme maturation permease subunit
MNPDDEAEWQDLTRVPPLSRGMVLSTHAVTTVTDNEPVSRPPSQPATTSTIELGTPALHRIPTMFNFDNQSKYQKWVYFSGVGIVVCLALLVLFIMLWLTSKKK